MQLADTRGQLETSSPQQLGHYLSSAPAVLDHAARVSVSSSSSDRKRARGAAPGRADTGVLAWRRKRRSAALTPPPPNASRHGWRRRILPGTRPGRWLIDRLDDHLVRFGRRLVPPASTASSTKHQPWCCSWRPLPQAPAAGDAEVRTRGYALTAAPDHQGICDRLRAWTSTRSGHHGSRNATPKLSLFTRSWP